jgi:sugar phosphate isomerase/epimerase
MNMKNLSLFTIMVVLFSCNSPNKNLDNTFYAFNNCVRMLPNAPETLEGQVELVKKIGFDGFSGHQSQDYFKLRAALDEVGLKMPEIYWGITIDEQGGANYKEDLINVIHDSENRDLMIALFINADAYKDNKDEGDPVVAAAIADIADYAAAYGAKVAIYPHIGNYCETSEHSVKLTKLIDRNNVGAIFNTCHLLKVEGEEGWDKKLLNALPYLYMISINGADSGDTQKMGWDRLIQPLGEGTFDTWKIVKLAKDNGYEGLFGLQCYNIKQDCEVALTKSIQTWEDYKERYAKE